MEKMLRSIREEHTRAPIFSFLDDTQAILHTVEEAIGVLRKMIAAAGERGMKVNMRKCYIFSPRGFDGVDREKYPELNEVVCSTEASWGDSSGQTNSS
jgi:hypothetical protein